MGFGSRLSSSRTIIAESPKKSREKVATDDVNLPDIARRPIRQKARLLTDSNHESPTTGNPKENAPKAQKVKNLAVYVDVGASCLGHTNLENDTRHHTSL